MVAYEFTKRKLAADRRARIKRWGVTGVVGCAGLALGIASNDMNNVFGILAASTLAAFPALAVHYLMN